MSGTVSSPAHTRLPSNWWSATHPTQQPLIEPHPVLTHLSAQFLTCLVILFLQRRKGCDNVLNCTIHSVQAAQSRDGSALDGWYIISLHCAALERAACATPPKAGRRRDRPAGVKKTTAAGMEEQQPEGANFDVVQISTSVIPSLSSDADKKRDDSYWTQFIGRPRTRSTNPNSPAMLAMKRKQEESERLQKLLDYSTSEKGLAAAAAASAAKRSKKQPAKQKQINRQQHKEMEVEDEKHIKSPMSEDEAQVEQAEAEQVDREDAAIEDGLVALLYKQTDTEEQESHTSLIGGHPPTREGQQESGAVQKEVQNVVAATSSSAPASVLLRCQCSFLLADSVYQRRSSMEWPTGSWCSMRQRTSDGAVHTRIGRVVHHIVAQPTTSFRSLRVLWYRTVAVAVQTVLPRVRHRRREVSEQSKTCAVIDTDQQLAAVSPWEITRLPHPPVRFPCNVGASNALLTLPKPEAFMDDPLSVQQRDQLLTSLCLEQLYDQLAGHLHLDFEDAADRSAVQKRTAFARLVEWHRSLRQLRERHVAGTLSGFDELTAAVQSCTQQLIETVAYESAVSPLVSSCSLLALRIACLVWKVLGVASSAGASGLAAMQQQTAVDSASVHDSGVRRNRAEVDASMLDTGASSHQWR